MSARSRELKLDTCGCCEQKPERSILINAPGQPSLTYRLGTHSTFLRRMLAHLRSQALPDGRTPLEALTTRDSEDPAIALLDSWATVADVITFYQERIANEGYLRTATERRSVLELARTIGYELRPGVAAGTYLAFTVDESLGSPHAVKISKGTKVQSVPAESKLPQTFETSDEISAKTEWNAIKPRTSQPQNLRIVNGTLYFLSLDGWMRPAEQLYFEGTSTNIKPGDLLLVALENIASNTLETLSVLVQSVQAEDEFSRTRVDLGDLKGGFSLPPAIILTKEVSHATPVTQMPFTEKNIEDQILNQSWYESGLQAFITINHWDPQALLKHINELMKPKPLPDNLGIFVFRQRLGFFGHNAPRWETLPAYQNTRGKDKSNKDPYENSWDGVNEPTIWTDSQSTSYSSTGSDVYLERSVPEVHSQSWVFFEAAGGTQEAFWVYRVNEATLVDYALSGKATGLNLTSETTGSRSSNHYEYTLTPSKFKVRKTTAYVQSERLKQADVPIPDAIEKGATSLTLDRMVLGLRIGQPLVVSGEEVVTGEEVASEPLHEIKTVTRHELVLLDEITHKGGFTTITFHSLDQSGLQFSYIRKSVKFNANVVLATHGESVREVIGSGDASQPNQRFVLRKQPLTYISAQTFSGADSTLSVRVDDVLWRESHSLYGVDFLDQKYVVRIDNDGKASIVFGDGKMGARLPSGIENIVANYRTGTGPDGEVDAGSLTLLQTQPLGVREVTNPLRATGAKSPEKLDDAKNNAPLTIMTLNRIVCLEDFEDFARAFAGVGKAQAVALWIGNTRVVHITIAPSDGRVTDSSSQVYINLVKAIEAATDLTHQVRVQSHQPLSFNLAARILIDSRLISASVLRAVEEALKSAFSFERRAFGQPVTAAQIITIIQQVHGVMAVDLFQLYLATEKPGDAPSQVLPALTARWDSGLRKILAAQLLLLNPAGITLTEMTP